jgi:hypothetical protein
LDTDTPEVRLESDEGKILSHLRVGADLAELRELLSNKDICGRGVQLIGTGFAIDRKQAERMLKISSDNRKVIHDYQNGKDLAQRSRGLKVIDFFGYELAQARLFEAPYQHILNHVKPERENNNRQSYRNKWWLFGENSVATREAVAGLPRYIAIPRTAKHYLFSFLNEGVIADAKLVVAGLNRGCELAILSSRLHVLFALSTGGFLEDRPTYHHSEVFYHFPFASLTEPQSNNLDELGERLDAFRKARLAEHDFLTMTGMYNVLNRLHELAAGVDVPPLTTEEKDVHEGGLISVLKDIHDEIDREVFAAYAWSDLGERIIGKPGATTPSRHKSEDQEAAEEELMVRLVALNQERAAEERRGQVRWLRPGYQKPRLAHRVTSSEQVEAELLEAGMVEEISWPADGLAQIRTVRDLLQEADAPLGPDAISAMFKGRSTQRRKDRVAEVLETLAATGAARASESAYFVPR